MTTRQKECLDRLRNGPSAIPAIVAGKLIALGYARKATPPANGVGRGYSYVEITAAGRTA